VLTEPGILLKPTLYPYLFEHLIKPVLPVLEQASTVYIIPTGAFHYVPLGALTPALFEPPPLLADGRQVVYAPSATILLNYCRQRPLSKYSGTLAIAPYDDKLSCTYGAAHTIANLSNTAPVIGPSATRQAFLDQAGVYRVLCFLGHAYVDPSHPLVSRLRLVDGPLHAGGILRELRLNADLVVLAACESGRSHVLRGDEILGLSRALLYAGTPSLLVTLWKVHEIPTRLLMENFFAQLGLNDSSSPEFDPALALARSQRWLRELTLAEICTLMAGWSELSPIEVKEWLARLWQMTNPGCLPQDQNQIFNHPFFWSPFVLIGDQRRG
jgi:CHAT domain-containing protein